MEQNHEGQKTAFNSMFDERADSSMTGGNRLPPPQFKTNASHDSPVVQRKMDYDKDLLGNFQFYTTGERLGFVDSVAKWNTNSGESIDHIIPFHTIENDLCIRLNELLANPKGGTEIQNLKDLHASLYPTQKPVNHYKFSVQVLDNVINQIQNGNTSAYNVAANQLLSYLNSAPDNLRIGDSNTNSSIGENLDCDFQSGSFNYSGVVEYSGGQKIVNNHAVLLLTDDSNTILYNYFSASPSDMFSFVLDNNKKQMSSVQPPTKSGLPVLVTDPNKKKYPYLFE